MSDPVEIMADAIDSLNPLYESEPAVRVALAALEASGWRLVHPEKISEPMKCAGDPWTEGRDFTHECLAQAIRAAPTYGDKA